MDYDNASDVYHAQGSVVITYEGGVLTADEVEFDKKNNIATAYGNALLKMSEDTLAGDKIAFNVENKTGVAYKGRAFYAKNHFYIRGDEIEKTGELTYKIIQPVATTCDGDKPDWEIAGSEMKVTVEGYGLMKNARLVTNKVPVFYSPIMPFPAKTKRQSGFLFPYLSYSKDKDGVDIELPYFWAISPQMDATLYSRYIEKRGLKEGVEFRYYAGEKSFGTLYGDYLDDNKHLTDATTGSTTTTTNQQDLNKRWSYYLNHQTNFDSQSYIRTDLRRVSDNWYFRDFSAKNYWRDNYAETEKDPFRKVPFLGDESLASLESTARFYKGWSNYNLTALMSSTDNLALTNNDSTLQKYPEITFTGIKQPLLKSPLYYEFTAVYDYFYRGAGQKGHFIDVNPTFSLPFNISRYAKVIPQVALRETFWSREDEQAQGDSKTGTRSIYNFSLAVSSQVSRVFDVNIQNWNKIRHEIKPEITYAYTPNVSQNNIPDFAPIITPTVTPVTAATTNAIMEQNAVAWGVTNTFTAKQRDAKGAYSYLEFLRVKLLQTYDINEAKKEVAGTAERRYLSDMVMEVDFKPHRYLSFAARNQYSVYKGWTVTNYDASISDWRGDSATLSYRYTLDSIEQIDAYLKAVITDKLDATFISRRDQFNSRTVENTLGFVYHKQCWAVGLDYSKTDSLGLDSKIATDTRFILKFSLTGLGKFGM
ncbi:MAG: LPS-assembly protein LptD [Smithellaceae bacterium]